MKRRTTSTFAFAFALAGGIAVLAAGCRDATQMTLEIALAPKMACEEMRGTALTVGIDAVDTERRVENGYVTASTNACDPSTRMIGTLVVTPSDEGQASVVVVTAYDPSLASPTACKPPKFEGCIVARRRFTFTSYKKLRMPITIDPDCKNVPCDSLSTCRKGSCYSSEVVIEGDSIPPEPGALPDGGTSEAGIVIPDAGLGDGNLVSDGRADGGDATVSFDSGVPGFYCGGLNDEILFCAGGAAGVCRGAAVTCCNTQGNGDIKCVMDPAQCSAGSSKYCCEDADCVGTGGVIGPVPSPGSVCNKPEPRARGAVGTCGPPVAPPPPPPF